MSKSKGNVVDPDDMMQKYGADALRLYVMFVAPPEKEVEWTDAGLKASFGFLARVWRLVDQWCETARRAPAPKAEGLTDAERKLRRKTHETIRRVTADIEQRIHLNTAISALMELVNELYAFGERLHADASRGEAQAVLREGLESLVIMLSPFAPHTSEEIWERLGHAGGLSRVTWPAFDEQAARAEEIVVPVQVNGKLRSRLTVPAETSESEIREFALADPAVKNYTTGKTIKSVVVAKGRLVNVVVQ